MIAARPSAALPLEPVAFAGLVGWDAADHAAAWRAVRTTATAMAEGTQPLRPAVTPSNGILASLGRIASLPAVVDGSEARRLFDRCFVPARVGGPGFLTGYYEPVVSGSRRRTADFTAPILPRPADLVTFATGERHPNVPADHSAGHVVAGRMEPYADRAALEAVAITDVVEPIVWLRDWTEVYLVHVQGSARVVLDDGTTLRLTYAGRNGHPYTSIGKVLIAGGAIAEPDMTLAALKSWLRAAGQDEGDPGRALMQRNRSYIFFRAEPDTGDTGPIGGAGVALTPRRSVAIDRTLWPYGLPFWIESERAVPGFGPAPLARLFVAEDTGSAIVGAARADLFLGSGDAAGTAAGGVRHAASFTVLWPR